MMGTYKSYQRDRNFEILRLRDSGMTYAEIGKKFGIGSERVRQICVVARVVQKKESCNRKQEEV